MTTALRARDFGLACGALPTGARNSIADVPGLRVGHQTIVRGDLRTGVTAIVPPTANVFRRKPVAAAHVLNGFGKSAGLVQVEELGSLETPILLTNTLAVGTCCTALIRHALRENPDIGRETSTVNPVVLECNDGFLNDIQALAVTEADAETALATASSEFASGAVGAGTGMSAFGFKGGIGTSSRRLTLDGETFHVGVLVLANFGRAGDLRLPDGARVAVPVENGERTEKGSIIIVMATDIPLNERQLKRVIRRSGVGLARLGSFWGHGSGDIAVGFTTANSINHDEQTALVHHRALNENLIDTLFEAMADTTQESVLDAMTAAGSMTGRDGHFRLGLADALQPLHLKGTQPS